MKTERVIPRRAGGTYDCTNCEWQGKLSDTDAGQCPECHADIIPIDNQPQPY